MMQQPEPDDCVIATGETRSVREFVECAFDFVGLDPRKHVEIDRYGDNPELPKHGAALRANIRETSLVPLINEQGEKE